MGKYRPPITSSEYLDPYLTDIALLVSDHVRGSITDQEFHDFQDGIIARYRGKVSYKDLYLFDNEADYRHFIAELGFEVGEVEAKIQHELAHFNEAKRVGYNTFLGVWCCQDGLNKFLVQIQGDLDIEKRTAIALKPEDPSDYDRIL